MQIDSMIVTFSLDSERTSIQCTVNCGDKVEKGGNSSCNAIYSAAKLGSLVMKMFRGLSMDRRVFQLQRILKLKYKQ